MSRTRRAIFGFATDTGGQVLLTLANFALTPLILKETSQAQYGFWLTALSVLSYLGLMDMGLGVALTRAIAGESRQSNEAKINSQVSTAFFTFCGAGLFFALIGFGFSFFIPEWFGIPSADSPAVLQAFRIVVVAGALALPSSVFSSVLCGFQQMSVDNILRTAVAASALLVSLALLWAGLGVQALAISTLFTVIATGALSGWWALRCFPGLKLRPTLVNKANLRSLLQFGGYFQLGKVANTVALNSDSVVISGIMGAQHVPIYALTSKLATLFSFTLANKLPTAVFAAMSQMFAQREFDALRSTYLRLSVYAMRLAIVGATICALGNRDLVTLWVGGDQYGGAALSAIFCYWVLQDTLSRGTASAIFATGQLRGWAFVCLAEAVLNLGASLVLVKQYGLIGAALGTAIGKTLTSAWLTPLLVCRSINITLRHYSWVGVFQPIIRSLPAVALTVIIYWMLPETATWWKLAVLAIAAVFSNLVVFEGIAIARNPALARNAWHNVRSLIGIGNG